MPIELEQKYVVASERPWTVQTELLALLRRAGYAVTLQGEGRQRDTYYDTPEDRLLLGGGSLRLREKGRAFRLAVKSLVRAGEGTFARQEEELKLGREAEPMPFLRRLLPGVDLDALAVTAVVSNRRRTYLAAGPAGGRFELAFDDVIYRSPRGDREVRERQVEMERLTGSQAELERLVRASAARLPALRPAAESKYQRARRLTGTAAR